MEASIFFWGPKRRVYDEWDQPAYYIRLSNDVIMENTNLLSEQLFVNRKTTRRMSTGKGEKRLHWCLLLGDAAFFLVLLFVTGHGFLILTHA